MDTNYSKEALDGKSKHCPAVAKDHGQAIAAGTIAARHRRGVLLMLLTLVLFAAAYVPTAWKWGVPTHQTWAIDTLFWHGIRYGHGFSARYPPVLPMIYALTGHPLFKATELFHGGPPVSDAKKYRDYQYSQMLRWAQLVNVAFGLGTLLIIGRLGWILGSPEAGVLAAAFWSSLPLMGYYSVATNADVPYLFWSLLSIERVAQWHRRGSAWSLVVSAVAAALSVGTKDQAAGIVLGIPLLIVFPLVASETRASAGPSGWRIRLKPAAIWILVAGVAYSVTSAMVIDPYGYVRHVKALFGPGLEGYQAEDFTELATTYGGYILATGWRPVLFVMGAGVAAALLRPRLVIWLTVPLAIYTGLFMVGSRLGAHRFLLPHFALFSLLAGIGVSATLKGRKWESLVLAVSVVVLGMTGWSAALLMRQDPRGQADHWLADHGEILHSVSVVEYIPTYRPTRLQTTPPVHVLLDEVARSSPPFPPPITTRFLVLANTSSLNSMMNASNAAIANPWRNLYENGPPGSVKIAEFTNKPLPFLWDYVRRYPLGIPGLYQTIRVFDTRPAVSTGKTVPANSDEYRTK